MELLLFLYKLQDDSWQLAVGGWAVGSWQLAVGS
jgi:hypothetical protein